MSRVIYLLFIGLLALCTLTSCGEDEECYNCTLGATQVDVCTSTYEDQAASNNLDVGSLDEYLDEISRTGFSCSLIPQ